MNVLDKIKNLTGRSEKQEVNAFDSVIESLRQHKVEVEIDEENGRCGFQNVLNYYLFKYPDDPGFFSLYAFGIWDVTKENELMVYRAINEVNNTTKMVKFGINQDCVNMEIPAFIFQKEETDDMLTRCFLIGRDAFIKFRKEMEKQEKEESEKRVRVVGFH